MSLYKNCGWWKNSDCIFEFSVKSYVTNTINLSWDKILLPSVIIFVAGFIYFKILRVKVVLVFLYIDVPGGWQFVGEILNEYSCLWVAYIGHMMVCVNDPAYPFIGERSQHGQPVRRPICRINLLTPNDPYMGRTAPLTSKRCILYIYSTNISTEHFKHALYSPFFLFKMQFVL